MKPSRFLAVTLLLITLFCLISCGEREPVPSVSVFSLPGGADENERENLISQLSARLDRMLYGSVVYHITVGDDETVTLSFDDYTLSDEEIALLCNRKDTPSITDGKFSDVLTPAHWTGAAATVDVYSKNAPESTYAVVLNLNEEGQKQILIRSGEILRSDDKRVLVRFGDEILAELSVQSRITGETGLILTGMTLDEARLCAAKLCLPPLDFDLAPYKVT